MANASLCTKIVTLVRCYLPKLGYGRPGAAPDELAMDDAASQGGAVGKLLALLKQCCPVGGIVAPGALAGSSANPNSDVAKTVMQGGGGFAPMESASLSFSVDFDDEEDEGSTTDGGGAIRHADGRRHDV